MYRDSSGHAGYEILREWKLRLCRKRTDLASLLPDKSSLDVTTEPFFVYSSNVDAHFHRLFAQNEVYEIHGTTEARYVAWEAAVEEVSKVIKVPSVRMECEMVARDIQCKTQSTDQVRHIRINPTDIDGDDDTASPALRQIQSTGLAALMAIAKHMDTAIATM
ncbi:hypothetical protein DYB36_000167 [Aphanomyces astaci]|uniref:Uncharacterized protein n=1 Tax=Aphanomyces astaci TaxID=112090 RepID=A0A397AF73_APHAT|nr:hypothetical protein DYB36_000167 [Aphanomyces astaci]